jgi:hypothetical protein
MHIQKLGIQNLSTSAQSIMNNIKFNDKKETYHITINTLVYKEIFKEMNLINEKLSKKIFFKNEKIVSEYVNYYKNSFILQRQQSVLFHALQYGQLGVVKFLCNFIPFFSYLDLSLGKEDDNGGVYINIYVYINVCIYI